MAGYLMSCTTAKICLYLKAVSILVPNWCLIHIVTNPFSLESSSKKKDGGSFTVAPVPLEVHVAPLAVIQPPVTGLHLDAPGAHIHDQVEQPVHQLDGEEVGPLLLVRLRPLQAAMAEQQQAAGLHRAEVKGYGACLLCVPSGQRQVGRRCVEGDWLQGLHALAAEYQVTMDTDLRVSLFSQP